ncbi:UDP-glucose dehydrogenase family protein [Piscinibacter koreensis]|uniref:UDP-glucose 6-dehydrogenase n=1 Tax=Piscinibacter koreensis TaxID=2742824 RepID=A0A7Y6TVP3_9BURK|nr:UDP-glucose/GDP-mannose dehydrogenase family protein [Schlegelella koreensis]NUZ05147.1 UDP-glucose/GDP-mannose dehydrogenase family protein [Schlegelella koreensis]
MRISIVGSGYVGLVTGACLAEMGNDVLCVDTDASKIRLLSAGSIPIYEPGLPELVERNSAAGRLRFTTDFASSIAHGLIIFIAVGTPAAEDGSADLQHVLAVADKVGSLLTDYRVIVNKSTVPVGTADRVQAQIGMRLSERGVQTRFAVASNPEFLKEGAAIDDFMRPDRVVIGSEDDEAISLLRSLYAPFTRNHDRLHVMDVRSAELTKYAANAMLATRISFVNDLARLAEKVGADIELVRRGIGSDRRIGTHFLYAGAGYGGSCFPKDVRALVHTGREYGIDLEVLTAVDRVNHRQKRILADKVVSRFGEQLNGRTLAIWGLAFKPETDDMREAPSLVVLEELVKRGARVQAYDPIAATAAQRLVAHLSGVNFVSDRMRAVEGADALLVMTEWREFRSPELTALKKLLRSPIIFDGRNLFEPSTMAAGGFEYYAVGRGDTLPERPSELVP